MIQYYAPSGGSVCSLSRYRRHEHRVRCDTLIPLLPFSPPFYTVPPFPLLLWLLSLFLALQELPNNVWRGIFAAAEGRQDAIKHPDTVKEVNCKSRMPYDAKERNGADGDDVIVSSFVRSFVLTHHSLNSG